MRKLTLLLILCIFPPMLLAQGQFGMSWKKARMRLSSLTLISDLTMGSSLKLEYDATNYVDFTASSAGDLTIYPVGGDITINSHIYMSGGDFYTDRWLSAQPSNTFIGVGVVGAGNLAHNSGFEGYYNSFFGASSGYNNTTGYYNSFLGNSSGYGNTTGCGNSVLGYNAGRYQSKGVAALQTPENSVYVGALAKSGSDSTGGEDVITNEIVIGYNTVGNGSCTITLGNDNITDTYLKGIVSVGVGYYAIDSTPDSNLSWSGAGAIVDTVGENVSFGDALYMKSDGKLWKADASVYGTSRCLWISGATITADNTGLVVCLNNYVRDDTWTWTVGGDIFLSTTAGGLTQVAPSTTGEQVVLLGVATHADRFYFHGGVTVVEVN